MGYDNMDLNSLWSSMFAPHQQQTAYGPVQRGYGEAQPGWGGAALPISSPQAGGQNDLLKFLMAQQPSAGQSIAGALPFLGLPGQQQANLKPYQEAIDAIGNAQSPMYQRVYGQQKQQGQDNLADQIAQLSAQNRKLSAMGRTPLFDQERGGEQLFRGLTQGYQDVQNQAATNSRNILGQQATGYGNIAGQQNQIAANKAGINGNLLGGLAKLFGL